MYVVIPLAPVLLGLGYTKTVEGVLIVGVVDGGSVVVVVTGAVVVDALVVVVGAAAVGHGHTMTPMTVVAFGASRLISRCTRHSWCRR